MNWKTPLLLALVIALAGIVGPAHALILPGTVFHKYELSLDGFGKLIVKDPDGTPGSGDEYVVARSLTLVDTPMKDQGLVPYMPYPFVTGNDGLPGSGSNNVSFTGTLAFLAAGLKVIGIDVYQGIGSYNLVTSDSAIIAILSSGLKAKDIVYLGDDPKISGDPYGVFTWDPTVSASSFTPGHDGWNAAGDLYTNSSSLDLGIGGVNDTTILTTKFIEFGGLEVDSLGRAAMNGTLIANVVTGDGSIRPVFFMEVTGGVDAPWVVPGGMKTTLGKDTDGDGWVDYGQYQDVVADIIAAVGTKPLYDETPPYQTDWYSFSDPAEWVAQPEPASILIWGGLAGAGLLLARRRKG